MKSEFWKNTEPAPPLCSEGREGAKGGGKWEKAPPREKEDPPTRKCKLFILQGPSSVGRS